MHGQSSALVVIVDHQDGVHAHFLAASRPSSVSASDIARARDQGPPLARARFESGCSQSHRSAFVLFQTPAKYLPGAGSFSRKRFTRLPTSEVAISILTPISFKPCETPADVLVDAAHCPRPESPRASTAFWSSAGKILWRVLHQFQHLPVSDAAGLARRLLFCPNETVPISLNSFAPNSARQPTGSNKTPSILAWYLVSIRAMRAKAGGEFGDVDRLRPEQIGRRHRISHGISPRSCQQLNCGNLGESRSQQAFRHVDLRRVVFQRRRVRQRACHRLLRQLIGQRLAFQEILRFSFPIRLARDPAEYNACVLDLSFRSAAVPAPAMPSRSPTRRAAAASQTTPGSPPSAPAVVTSVRISLYRTTCDWIRPSTIMSPGTSCSSVISLFPNGVANFTFASNGIIAVAISPGYTA